MFAKTEAREPARQESSEDVLLDLASRLEPDGGMPGRTASERAARTIAAVLAFVEQGHTPTAGAFRSHVARLVAFLVSIHGISPREQALVDAAIQAASAGCAPPGDWLALARLTDVPWSKLEAPLRLS